MFIFLFILLGVNCIELRTIKNVMKWSFNNSESEGITYTAWLQHMHQLRKNFDENEGLAKAFRLLDKNRDGNVSAIELFYEIGGTVEVMTGPQQIHIGFTNTTDEMQVMWITQPDIALHPIVRYGINPVLLDAIELPATWQHYSAGHVGFHGRIYRAVMKNLSVLTTYYYQVGDSITKKMSTIRKFKAGPGANQHLDKIHIAVFGDMGTIVPLGFAISKDIYRQNLVRPLDFVFLTGDIAYAGISNQKVGQLEPLWDLYGQLTDKWASQVPFMPGVGNHQKYYDYLAYRMRYQLPRSDLSPTNYWFSFDYGQLHVVHISSEHSYKVGSQQREFLELDLKKAHENQNIKWIILGAHRPFYASSDKNYNQKNGLALQLEELVSKYRVDVVQTGHMHCYERTWPTFNGKAEKSGHTEKHFYKPKSPIYVVQGTAGALIHETWLDPIPEWSLVRLQRYGFGTITIQENLLTYKFLEMTSGKVIDQWMIEK